MKVETGIFIFCIGMFIGHVFTYERLKRLWKPKNKEKLK